MIKFSISLLLVAVAAANILAALSLGGTVLPPTTVTVPLTSSDLDRQPLLIRPFEIESSWYGSHFDGRITASGTIYDSTERVAAARWLPLGQKFLLVNPKNNRRVVVRIVDRISLRYANRLDVSEATATRLNFHETGVTKLIAREVK